MNSGVINQSLLEKDIEQILYYAGEEEKLLNDLCSKLESSSSSYKSNNTSTFVSDIGNFKNNISKIHNKRLKYVEILQKVIASYNQVAQQNQNLFDGYSQNNNTNTEGD